MGSQWTLRPLEVIPSALAHWNLLWTSEILGLRLCHRSGQGVLLRLYHRLWDTMIISRPARYSIIGHGISVDKVFSWGGIISFGALEPALHQRDTCSSIVVSQGMRPSLEVIPSALVHYDLLSASETPSRRTWYLKG